MTTLSTVTASNTSILVAIPNITSADKILQNSKIETISKEFNTGCSDFGNNLLFRL